MRPLKLVVNCGNGAAGPTFDSIADAALKQGAKIEFVRVNHQPDSSFPNGIPNPLLKENQSATGDIVIKEKADLGIAFDGDFDRCFFFDNKGRYVPAEYIIGFLSGVFLEKNPGRNIVHDPRVIWNIENIISKFGGAAILSKTGHSLIKKAMRDNDAVYGGEMSGHHYFRNFFYCDSGMIPWLLICEFLGTSEVSMSRLMDDRINLFPSSGEINFRLKDPDRAITLIEKKYRGSALSINLTDGLTMVFANWRFNVRRSNTEPLVRLNLETRADKKFLNLKIIEIRRFFQFLNV